MKREREVRERITWKEEAIARAERRRGRGSGVVAAVGETEKGKWIETEAAALMAAALGGNIQK